MSDPTADPNVDTEYDAVSKLLASWEAYMLMWNFD